MQFFIIILIVLVFPVNALAEEDAVEPVIEYLEMTPKFTVNLAERKKYLQINVQLLVAGEDQIENIKKHFPALRHELIMLFSGQSITELQTARQRDKLRTKALAKLTETLAKLDKSDGLKDVFFTEFLVN